jgi:hypothetical protein
MIASCIVMLECFVLMSTALCINAYDILRHAPCPVVPPGCWLALKSDRMLAFTCCTLLGCAQVKAESDLDRLLLSDAVADEASWSSFHEEEAVVKVAVADHIWEDLVAETAYLLEDMTWTLVAAQQPV